MQRDTRTGVNQGKIGKSSKISDHQPSNPLTDLLSNIHEIIISFRIVSLGPHDATEVLYGPQTLRLYWQGG